MTDAELHHKVKMLAIHFSLGDARRAHPRLSEDALWRIAHPRWEQYVERALDCLAMMEVAAEDDAAPWN